MDTKKYSSSYYKKFATKANPNLLSLKEASKIYNVKQSDFVNRKAYLNYLARRLGFKNYNAWLKARENASLKKGTGGRKSKKILIHIDINKELNEFNLAFYCNKLKKQIENNIYKDNYKYLRLNVSQLTFTYDINTMYNKDLDILCDYLSMELDKHSSGFVMVNFIELKFLVENEPIQQGFINPELLEGD
mgnify:CR=1 FL=1